MAKSVGSQHAATARSRRNSRRFRSADRAVVVECVDNQLRFVGRVNAFAHRQFLRRIHDLRNSCDELVLDFSAAEAAFPNGMVPLLLSVESLRRRGIKIAVTLPSDPDLERLFKNANWSHFLDPEVHAPSDTTHERHLATHRFTNADEQQKLVNAVMDVVMRTMTLERDVIAGLEWSINEITDNVLNHAQTADGGLVQVSTFKDAKKVAFAVGDSGRGILASLREGYPQLRTDAQALGEAVKSGITRNPEAGQGNGLAGTLRIASMSGGSFELGSGLADLIVRRGESRTHLRGEEQQIDGTLVYAEVGLESHFHLAEALGFGGKPYQPVDVIELMYETDRGDATVLRLRDESTGFGSRPAGRQLRTKCTNLLNAEPDKPLILDWTGVPLVSSSFADELVGKLFVQLGPLGFSARVRNIGMEALVRGLIDKAIMQRAAQAAQAGRALHVDELADND